MPKRIKKKGSRKRVQRKARGKGKNKRQNLLHWNDYSVFLLVLFVVALSGFLSYDLSSENPFIIKSFNFMLDPNIREYLTANVAVDYERIVILVAPNASSLTLTTTNPATNDVNQNLTATWIINDEDNDPVKNVTNWYLNGTSISVLHMPFENNTVDISSTTKDYSSFDNNGTVSGATWNATGGYDDWATYEFDGINDYISVNDSNSLNLTDSIISVLLHVKDTDENGGFTDHYTMTEISSTYNSYSCSTSAGSRHSGSGDDGIYQTTLGFNFTYYGKVKSPTTNIYMDTNGRLIWDEVGSDYSASAAEMEANHIIAANWQDLGDENYNNEYICTNQGTSPNKYAVFRWDNEWYSGGGSSEMEIVLFENDSSVLIRYGTFAAHSDTWIRGISNGSSGPYSYVTASNVYTNDSNRAFRYKEETIVNTKTLLDKNGSYTLEMLNKSVYGYLNGNQSNNVTVDLVEDVWAHLALTYDGSNLRLYKDGNQSDTLAVTENITSTVNNVTIGNLFEGSIDDVMIFNRSLSAQQISVLYDNVTSTFVNQETSVSDVWNVSVTPNDGGEDGMMVMSNQVLINAVSSPTPSVPEFSDYAIALLLLTVVGGFLFIRNSNHKPF